MAHKRKEITPKNPRFLYSTAILLLRRLNKKDEATELFREATTRLPIELPWQNEFQIPPLYRPTLTAKPFWEASITYPHVTRTFEMKSKVFQRELQMYLDEGEDRGTLNAVREDYRFFSVGDGWTQLALQNDL